MLTNTQNSIIINTGKDLETQERKHGKGSIGAVDKWVFLSSTKNIYRPSGMIENLISDSFDTGLHLANILEVLKK